MPSAMIWEWSRKAYGVAWRLAVLSLPWQARWFAEGAQVAGWPWEQGRLSLYVSWLPLTAAIFLGTFQFKAPLQSKIVNVLLWPLAALGVVTLLVTPSNLVATAQWWFQIVLLAMFAVVTLRTDMGAKKVMFWFALSLLPCAAMSLAQVWTQRVWGASWLGMSSQDPATLGVSVVQSEGLRWLRAYGIFPHPNIFGAWMVVGVLSAVYLYAMASRLSHKYFWLAVQAVFSAGLFYSFSRSAWIAAAVGLTAFFFASATRTWTVEWQKTNIAMFVMPVAMFIVLIVASPGLIWTRMTPDASWTERKSVDVRMQSLRDGLSVYAAYPFFGTGPGNYLPALAQVKKSVRADAPLEPPHLVWLLALAETGTLGFAALAWAAISLVMAMRDARRSADSWVWSLALSAGMSWLAALLFDHYAWSLWSGQSLTAIIFLLTLTAIQSRQEKES